MEKARKIDKKTKCDLVTEGILRMITDEPYRPGSLLPTEAEFCQIFSVSRVTVRESLKRLSNMGVISICQGEGTYVNELTIPSLLQNTLPLRKLTSDSADAILDARICMESGIAKMAARNRTTTDLEQLRACLKSMESCSLNSDVPGFASERSCFHERIALSCKNEILLSFYYLLNAPGLESLHSYSLSPQDLPTSCLRYAEILDALDRKDAENIASLVRLELMREKRALNAHL